MKMKASFKNLALLLVVLSLGAALLPSSVRAETASFDGGMYQTSRHGHNSTKSDNFTAYIPDSSYQLYKTGVSVYGHRHGSSEITVRVCLLNWEDGECTQRTLTGSEIGPEYGGEHPFNFLWSDDVLYGSMSTAGNFVTIYNFVKDAEVRTYISLQGRRAAAAVDAPDEVSDSFVASWSTTDAASAAFSSSGKVNCPGSTELSGSQTCGITGSGTGTITLNATGPSNGGLTARSASKDITVGGASGPPGGFDLETPDCSGGANPLVSLDWDSSSGADSYEVWRCRWSTCDGLGAIATGLTQSSYADNTVSSGVNYNYYVKALNSLGSTQSDTESVSTETSNCGGQPPVTGRNKCVNNSCTFVANENGADECSPAGSSCNEPPIGEQYCSEYISQSAPASLAAGSTATVSVTMKNCGTKTWTPPGGGDINTNLGFKLGSQNPQDNTTWNLARIGVSNAVPKNQTETFDFVITAPSTAGTYNFQWRMVDEFVRWFGNYAPNLQIEVGEAPPACQTEQVFTLASPEVGLQEYARGGMGNWTSNFVLEPSSDGSLANFDRSQNRETLRPASAPLYFSSGTSRGLVLYAPPGNLGIKSVSFDFSGNYDNNIMYLGLDAANYAGTRGYVDVWKNDVWGFNSGSRNQDLSGIGRASWIQFLMYARSNYTYPDANWNWRGDVSNIRMTVCMPKTLGVALTADPVAGYSPINDVDLAATVSGTASGPITYRFACDSGDSWGAPIVSPSATYTASNYCDYASAGTYLPKVEASRDGLVATASAAAPVVVAPPPPANCDFSASPSRVTLPPSPASSRLSWSCTGVPAGQNCSINEGIGPVGSAGDRDVSVVRTTNYVLDCRGEDGVWRSFSATVRAFDFSEGTLKEIPPAR